MKCTKCGALISPDALFCSRCGQEVQPEHNPMDDRALTRPKQGRLLGGVAAGMAEYFDKPVSSFRILWVILSVVTVGMTAIAYIALCFIIPEEKS